MEDEMHEEEMSMEDSVENTEYVLNVLIDLLVEKGVIAEKELEEKLEALDEDDEECSECGSEECTCE